MIVCTRHVRWILLNIHVYLSKQTIQENRYTLHIHLKEIVKTIFHSLFIYNTLLANFLPCSLAYLTVSLSVQWFLFRLLVCFALFIPVYFRIIIIKNTKSEHSYGKTFIGISVSEIASSGNQYTCVCVCACVYRTSKSKEKTKIIFESTKHRGRV